MKPTRPCRSGQRSSGRWLPGCLIGLFFSIPFPLGGQVEEEAGDFLRLEVDSGVLIDQALFVEVRDACAPAALANSLRQGTPSHRSAWSQLTGRDDTARFRYLIDRWFRTPNSALYPRKKRLSFDGVLEEDLAAATNEMLTDLELPTLTSGYLNRSEGESSHEFLTRIHRLIRTSLERGTPPMLSLKTYVAHRQEKRDDEIDWEPTNHHWVVVTGISTRLRPTDLGVSLDLIDPNGGRETSAFLFAENRLEFWALKGDLEQGKWLGGRPFLLVQAPGVLSLRPKEAAWTDRIIVVANHLIGDYGSAFR